MYSLDPFVKLYRETACVEHGRTSGHLGFTSSPMDYRWCPGGSRQEVVIDYEAAVAITNQLRLIVSGDEWDDLIHDITKEAVDAALKSAGFTKTFTSEKEHRE